MLHKSGSAQMQPGLLQPSPEGITVDPDQRAGGHGNTTSAQQSWCELPNDSQLMDRSNSCMLACAIAAAIAVELRMHVTARACMHASCCWCRNQLLHHTYPAGTNEVLYFPLISLWVGPRYPIDDSTLNATNSA
jgi:hypothetical protein